MSKTKIQSTQVPCVKCLKKYETDLTDWQACYDCPWTTVKVEATNPKEILTDETKKQCLACQELLDFLEPEIGKYLCGKVKCLRSYIANKAKEKSEDK